MNTVGRNKKKIAEYIQNHLREDLVADQFAPFKKGRSVYRRKNRQRY